ncbi:hypothetical protein THAOC_27919 [Thalassiosira oceanica]|uniref:Uncharacterized protein n=1 Tax=Thalassiosira oceanica TaxID=159749 RepID=K0RVC9_THAOC|nr:hypothetical protein THAOC_27919 [Thalassiosira oceanica]|eukprot:EJK52776.1 hypothetical protein THAOC_27919 [Thalassiosira oceanica]
MQGLGTTTRTVSDGTRKAELGGKEPVLEEHGQRTSRAGDTSTGEAGGGGAPSAYAIDPTWSMPRNKKYEPRLRELMQYVHRCEEPYEKGTTFTREQLLELKPEHIEGWLKMKAYGTDCPDIENGDRPIHARSSSLENSKKSVSFFMPNKYPQWCNGQGNPTKSSLLAEMIKDVKLFEVRGEGSESKAKRQERNVTAAGGTKQKYYRCNHVWKIIKRLINSGHNHHMACNKIHQVYGHDLSVTKIIAALIREKHRYMPFDCHPNLRV